MVIRILWVLFAVPILHGTLLSYNETIILYDFRVADFIAGLDGNDNSGNCDPIPSSCARSRYRSLDGSCNNLRNRGWGTPNSTYGRLLRNKYGDGIMSFPLAVSGNSLPNTRSLSLIFFPDFKIYDLDFSLLAQQWGQILTHDISITGGVTQTNNSLIVCCDSGFLTEEAFTSAQCAPIIIPFGDPVHRPGSCIDFSRTLNTILIQCGPPNRPAEQITQVSAYMDSSLIYGSSRGQSTPIRAFRGGLLRTVRRNRQDWPPPSPNVVDDCSNAPLPGEPCYLAGDIRVNQNTQLTMLQVILLREHNRVATALSNMNPRWGDETIYQEARRIVIAELQHINYYEYLPILLGYENMVYNKLIYPDERGYIDDYNMNINAAPINEYANAAFRFFHTLIRGYLKLFFENRTYGGQIRLSDWFNRPIILEKNNNFNDLVRGITYEESGGSDQYFDNEITQFLFRGNNTFGKDLRAIDIQRGRDHGLGNYVSARAACNLPVPEKFKDLRGYMSRQNVNKLRRVYENLEDIELVVGGALEERVPGAFAGPTFVCIVMKQFYRTRVGDRFHYENGADKNIAFSLNQLNSIRRASIARILCDNSDVSMMQPQAFRLVKPGNQPVPCNQLPAIDLSLWKDNN